MYTVTMDGILIHDLLQEIAVINLELEYNDNTSGSFEFELPPNNPGYNIVKNYTSVIRVLKDGEEIFTGRPYAIEKDFYNVKQVSCEGELAFLLDSIQRPEEYHTSIRGFLQAMVDSHNSQVDAEKKITLGMVTVVDDNDYIYRYTNWERTLDAVNKKLVDRLGGHIRIRKVGSTRYLDYVDSYDNTNTQKIEFGSNMLDYTESIDASEIATVIIPLGARLDESKIDALEEYLTIKSVNSGLDYIYDSTAVAQFGKISRTVHFDDVTLPANLKKKGLQYLHEVQFEDLSLELNALDLNIMDVDIERIKLGDDIRCLSAPHGMDRFFPVTQLKLYLDSPDKNMITLGTRVRSSYTDRNDSVNSEIIKRINSIPPESKTLKTAKDNASQMITAATHGHLVFEPNEMLVMDTADKVTARKVWRWNLNGLGYSKTGYNGNFGDMALTADGYINGRKIMANSIYADAISAQELGTAWNGITDYVQLKGGELNVYSTKDILVSKFNGFGSSFYRDGKHIGVIMCNSMKGYPNERGLYFGIETDASYMCWSYKKQATDTSYSTVLTYYANTHIKSRVGLHLGTDLSINNHDVYINDKNKIVGYTSSAAIETHNEFQIRNEWNTLAQFQTNQVQIFPNLYANLAGTPSDERLKDNIADSDVDALSIIKRMDFKQYDWIESGEHQELGLVAQELEKIDGGLINHDEHGVKHVNPTKLLYLALFGIQQMSGKTATNSVLRRSGGRSYSIQEKNQFIENLRLQRTPKKEAPIEMVSEPVEQ